MSQEKAGTPAPPEKYPYGDRPKKDFLVDYGTERVYLYLLRRAVKYGFEKRSEEHKKEIVGHIKEIQKAVREELQAKLTGNESMARVFDLVIESCDRRSLAYEGLH
ncbi:MAG: hypothetical protein HY652_14070 [Acidobacteria bacterium]|nr:hypothetical protein [Acidobacteriota bacterium]